MVNERAYGCCEYCLSQVKYSSGPFSTEHIWPKAKGGSDDPDNLAFSCQGCNSIKSVATTGEDPLLGLEVPLFHPRQDTWNEHFEWQDDCQIIVGITPTGRATVNRLELNRLGLLNLRKIMIATGVHPPKPAQTSPAALPPAQVP